jgi:hypothetical protein
MSSTDVPHVVITIIFIFVLFYWALPSGVRKEEKESKKVKYMQMGARTKKGLFILLNMSYF